MSYLAKALVSLTHLEWDLSQLTSYLPASSEIVYPGSFYTHWRKGGTMMVQLIWPISDICGRVR